MSKNRDLIYDMTDSPETEDFVQFDSEPLQLGGVGEDAPAAHDRQVTPPGDVWRKPGLESCRISAARLRPCRSILAAPMPAVKRFSAIISKSLA